MQPCGHLGCLRCVGITTSMRKAQLSSSGDNSLIHAGAFLAMSFIRDQTVNVKPLFSKQKDLHELCFSSFLQFTVNNVQSD